MDMGTTVGLANMTLDDIRQLQDFICFMEDDRENTVNYTDGSVSQQSGRAGAAFLCDSHLHSTILSNGSSILV